MCCRHSCLYNRFRVFFFQMNICLRAFSLKVIEMAFLFSGWCQTICSWMHVIFLIFVDVGLYNVNRRSICALKHPDVPFISFRKCLLILWTVFVLRNLMKFSSIYIYIYIYEKSMWTKVDFFHLCLSYIMPPVPDMLGIHSFCMWNMWADGHYCSPSASKFNAWNLNEHVVLKRNLGYAWNYEATAARWTLQL
jgi:hypothetical protein